MPQTRVLFPIAFRNAHYDAVLWQRPISVLSVIPDSPGFNYIMLYNNVSLRAEARDKAHIGWGNGGATWDSAVQGQLILNENGIMAPGMAYGLWKTTSEQWVVSWHWPRYKVTSDDWAEPMWEKLNYFSIVGEALEMIDVTKADSGTGSDNQVIARLPRYVLALINDLWAYDFTDPENPEAIPWAFYGVSGGVKGWYKLADMSAENPHPLLSAAHDDTTPAKPENIPGSIIVGESDKWKALQGDANKYQLLKAGAGNVQWVEPPGTQSITNADDGQLILVNDLAVVPANHYYGFKDGQKGWKKI